MANFDSLVESKIREAMEAGQMRNLRGEGKPLTLEPCPPGVPNEVWLTMNVLKNAGVLPPEMELMKEIEELQNLIAKTKNPAEKAQLLSSLSQLETEAKMRLEEFSRETAFSKRFR